MNLDDDKRMNTMWSDVLGVYDDDADAGSLHQAHDTVLTAYLPAMKLLRK